MLARYFAPTAFSYTALRALLRPSMNLTSGASSFTIDLRVAASGELDHLVSAGTTSTGHDACRITRSVVLPTKNRATRLRPLAAELLAKELERRERKADADDQADLFSSDPTYSEADTDPPEDG